MQSPPIRTLAAGGDAVNNIDMITISTLGDAQDFGDLLEARVDNRVF